jgi:hypothetical protein
VGVANYNSAKKIEAEDYFKAEGFQKKETKNGFVIATNANKSYANYPNIKWLKNKSKLVLNANAKQGGKFLITIKNGSIYGTEIAKKEINLKPSNLEEKTKITLNLTSLKSTENLYFLLEQLTNNQLQIDSFSFSK